MSTDDPHAFEDLVVHPENAALLRALAAAPKRVMTAEEARIFDERRDGRSVTLEEGLELRRKARIEAGLDPDT
jgi:hypothetical protein